MAKLRATNIDPKTGTNLTLGATGDTVTISSTEVRANTVKDAGGNTLWVSNGSGTLSSVNSALAGGGVTLLNTTTVPGNLDYVDFTSSIISSTYDEYWIFWYQIHNNNENEFLFNFSHNGGTTWSHKTSTTWNAQQPLNAGTGDFSYQGNMDRSDDTSSQLLTPNIQMDNDCGISGCLKLFQPSSSTINTWYQFNSSYQTTSGQIDHCYGGGYNNNPAQNATNHYRFNVGGSTPTMASGTFKIYGIG